MRSSLISSLVVCGAGPLAALLVSSLACGSSVSSSDAHTCPDYSGASLDEYYVDCSAASCSSPYACVEVEELGGSSMVCLLPCCVSTDCPDGQGCVGQPDWPVADVGRDGYCSEAP
jgi:hypothetical protein